MTDYFSKGVSQFGKGMQSLAEKAQETLASTHPLQRVNVQLEALRSQLTRLDPKDRTLLNQYLKLQNEAKAIIEAGVSEANLPEVLEYHQQLIFTSRRWEKHFLEKAEQRHKKLEQPEEAQKILNAYYQSYQSHQRFTNQQLSRALELTHSLQTGLPQNARALLARYQQKWQSYQANLEDDQRNSDGEYEAGSRCGDIEVWARYLNTQSKTEQNRKAIGKLIKTSLPRTPYSEAMFHGRQELWRRVTSHASGPRSLPTWANPTTVRRYYMTAMQMVGAMNIGDRLSAFYKKKSTSFVELADLGFEIMLPMLGLGTMKELARRGVPVLGQIMGAAAVMTAGEDLADQSISNARRELNGKEPLWDLRLMRMGIHFFFYVDAGLVAAPLINMGRGKIPRALGEGPRTRTPGRGPGESTAPKHPSVSIPTEGTAVALSTLGADAVADGASELVEGAAAGASTPAETLDEETALAVREAVTETDTEGVGETEGVDSVGDTDGDGPKGWQERFIQLVESCGYDLASLTTSDSEELQDINDIVFLGRSHPLVPIINEAGGARIVCDFYIEWLEQNGKEILSRPEVDNLYPILKNNFSIIFSADYHDPKAKLSPAQTVRLIMTMVEIGHFLNELGADKSDEILDILRSRSDYPRILQLEEGGPSSQELSDLVAILPAAIEVDEFDLGGPGSTTGDCILWAIGKEIFENALSDKPNKVNSSAMIPLMAKLLPAIKAPTYAEETLHQLYAYAVSTFVKDYKPDRKTELLNYPELFLTCYLASVEDAINKSKGDRPSDSFREGGKSIQVITHDVSYQFSYLIRSHHAQLSDYQEAMDLIDARLKEGELTDLERRAYAQLVFRLTSTNFDKTNCVPDKAFNLFLRLLGPQEIYFIFPTTDTFENYNNRKEFEIMFAAYLKKKGVESVYQEIQQEKLPSNSYILCLLFIEDAKSTQNVEAAWNRLRDQLHQQDPQERIELLLQIIHFYLEIHNTTNAWRASEYYDDGTLAHIDREIELLTQKVSRSDNPEDTLNQEALGLITRFSLLN